MGIRCFIVSVPYDQPTNTCNFGYDVSKLVVSVASARCVVHRSGCQGVRWFDLEGVARCQRRATWGRERATPAHASKKGY